MQFNCDRNRLASIFSNLLISTRLHIISYGGVGEGVTKPTLTREIYSKDQMCRRQIQSGSLNKTKFKMENKQIPFAFCPLSH